MPTALHESLRRNAWSLLERPGRPAQVNLRRAVSSAYYALFHLLVYQAVDEMVSRNVPGLQARVSRAFAHGDMKEVCSWFQHAVVPAKLRSLVQRDVSVDLQTIAKTFIVLQQERHAADYDPALQLSHSGVVELVDAVDQAFFCWKRIRGSQEADLFLAAMVFGKRWDR